MPQNVSTSRLRPIDEICLVATMICLSVACSPRERTTAQLVSVLPICRLYRYWIRRVATCKPPGYSPPTQQLSRLLLCSFCVYCTCSLRLTASALFNHFQRHDLLERAHQSSRRRQRERQNRRAHCDISPFFFISRHLQAPLVQALECPNRRPGGFRGPRPGASARERPTSTVQHGLAADAPVVVQRESHYQQSRRDPDGTIALWPWLR